MSKQYKTFLVLVFGIFVGISVSLTSSVLAEKKSRGIHRPSSQRAT